MSDLAAALQIAIRVHAAQTDKQGEPYLLHVLRVVEAVSDEAKVVAALHDVLEDGPAADCYRIHREVGLSDDEFVAFLALTKDLAATKGYETYANYIDHVASSNVLAREVKLADLRDNLERIPPFPPYDAAIDGPWVTWNKEWLSLKARYEKAIRTLEATG